MEGKPPRKQHPRITFSDKSSPEQGELDDDDIARKEIDAALHRQRKEDMRERTREPIRGGRSESSRHNRVTADPRESSRAVNRRDSASFELRRSKDFRDAPSSSSRTRSPDRSLSRRGSQVETLPIENRDFKARRSPERPKLTSTVIIPVVDDRPKQEIKRTRNRTPSPTRNRERERNNPVGDLRGLRHEEGGNQRNIEPDRSRKEVRAVEDSHRVGSDRHRHVVPAHRSPERNRGNRPEEIRLSREGENTKRDKPSHHGERRKSRDESTKDPAPPVKKDASRPSHGRSSQRPDVALERPRKRTPASPDPSDDEKRKKKAKTVSPVSVPGSEGRTSSSISSQEERSDTESESEASVAEVLGPELGPARPRFESTTSYPDVTEPVSAPTPERDAGDPVEPDHSHLPPYLPGIQGCRSIEEFDVMNRVEEGTYGVVYRARDKRTNQIVALKRLKMEKEKEGFPITSLREVSTLLKAHHKNVVSILEVIVGANMDKIYMVMEFVEHDLKALMERMAQPFLIGEVKTLMMQLLSAVAHLHDNWIIHRDLKTSNLLLSHKGILKVGDFGLAREYGSPLKPYTPIVVTLWYRCPELLLGAKEYSTAVDMWSVGCVFAEFLTLKPLFPGKSEMEQINKIFKELGNPSEENWPEYKSLPIVEKMQFPVYPTNTLRRRFPVTVLTNTGYDLLTKLLEYNPAKRINAEEALKHVHFTDSPQPVPTSMFPTWPAKSEQGPRGPRQKTPKPPSGGKQFKDLEDDDNGMDGFRMGASKDHARRKGDMGFQLRIPYM